MVTKEKDEELALFLEIRRREMEKSDDIDASLGTNNASGSPVSKIVSLVPARKTADEKFLDSENDKSDYDWLLTPPRSPLFPSFETEPRKTLISQNEMQNSRLNFLMSRLTFVQEEPASRTRTVTKRITLLSSLNSSNSNNRRPSSSAGPTSAMRFSTPTRCSTLPTSGKPSRPSTPTSRATLPSSKPAGPPVRSSTPTRNLKHSSTPTSRISVPASKSTKRLSIPIRQASTPSSAPSVAAGAGGRSSSETKPLSTTLKNVVPSRGSSPTVKSRPWKPNEMPGFSLDAPPNLKTSLPERPGSASRGRPGGANARSTRVETGSKGRLRQQSCSPARGGTSNSSGNVSRIFTPSKSGVQTNGVDDVNPIVMGTKMVERVVNMRKLQPKQDDHHSTQNNSGGKSSSLDSSGFGRTLSKKSLDMALRHMVSIYRITVLDDPVTDSSVTTEQDIRRSISGNIRQLSSIPASSVYSVRSRGSDKSKAESALDSPLATSSNASSKPSVNNSPFVEGIEREVNDNESEEITLVSWSGK